MIYNKMMKKFIYFSLCFLLLFVCPINQRTIFAEEKTYYGRAINKDIAFYSSPISSDENILFFVPKTYFVKLISDENDIFYKVSYMNEIYGYIKKSDMSYIDKTPTTPYANQISFRVFSPGGANLRRTPNESLGATNLITTIPFLETNLLFIGTANGEEAISYKGTTWYYCKYIKDNISSFGYVYSPLCDMLSPIPENNEIFEYVLPNFDSTTVSQITDKSDFLTLSSPAQIAIIIGVSLPCILIIYFLFKPTKISMQNPKGKITKESNKKKKTKTKKKIRRLKGSDYYELDGDFFD